MDKPAIMRWTVCVRRCTRSRGCLTIIDIYLDCSNNFSHEEEARARFQNTKKRRSSVDFLSTAFAPVPLAPDLQNTRRARMTRRPLVFGCRDETTCLRPNVLTGHNVSPNPTRQKARHSKWNCSEHLNRRQPTRNVRRKTRNQKSLLQNNQERTNRNTTDTMEGPETTTTTPLAPGNISDAARKRLFQFFLPEPHVSMYDIR